MKETKRGSESAALMWQRYYSGACSERVIQVPTNDVRAHTMGASFVAAVENDHPELVGIEQTITAEIAARLQKQKEVIYVDLGAGMGLSSLIIAQQFPKEIQTKRLRMIGTNVEPTFTIQSAIADAHRRLQFCGSFTGWLEIFSEAFDKGGYAYAETAIKTMKPPVRDIRTLQYIQRHHPSLEYVAGVDTTQLPLLLSKRAVQGADIIHEHFGGIFHAKDHRPALQAVSNSLVTGGILWTSKAINDDEYHYGDFRDYHLQPNGTYAWADRGYKQYTKI